MADERDYLDKSRDLAGHMTGETRDEINDLMPARFALYGLHKRASILDAIDSSTAKGDMEIEDLRGAMEKADLRRRLGDIHNQLRSRGR
jgi:hypothetical protein